MNQQIQLQTERLLLRPFTQDELLYAILHDEWKERTL
jgi:hypothetical protein